MEDEDEDEDVDVVEAVEEEREGRMVIISTEG